MQNGLTPAKKRRKREFKIRLFDRKSSIFISDGIKIVTVKNEVSLTMHISNI